MSRKSRRRFLGALVGGSLGLPGIIRAQISTGEDYPIVPDPTDSVYAEPPVSKPSGPKKKKKKGEDERPELELIRPKALREGSTIAIVAPASGVSRGEELDAAATLRNLGFKVKMGANLNKGYGYLAATDDVRAKEFMDFVRNPEVDCIMAVRGGYGVMRILNQIDFDEIRRNPKVIIGYSDITALVNPVYQLAGVVAFHGPMAGSAFDPFTLDSFRRTLMTTSAAGTFVESDEFKSNTFGNARASTIVPGKAQGRLVGGNLSLVTSLMGTPYDIDTRGKILFLEEVHEEPYQVDRMLTQLVLGGKFSACAGVALGRFNKCEAPNRGGEFNMSLSLEQVIRGLLEPLKIPTMYGISVGHIHSKLTIPIGALATIDADAHTITIDEAAVS